MREVTACVSFRGKEIGEKWDKKGHTHVSGDGGE
jgi:hypothetical protein